MTDTDTICSGCGSVEGLADIKGRAAQAISCCPERKMVPITRANITTLRQQLAEARNDCKIVMANLECVLEMTGESLDPEDAAIVGQIRLALKTTKGEGE